MRPKICFLTSVIELGHGQMNSIVQLNTALAVVLFQVLKRFILKNESIMTLHLFMTFILFIVMNVVKKRCKQMKIHFYN